MLFENENLEIFDDIVRDLEYYPPFREFQHKNELVEFWRNQITENGSLKQHIKYYGESQQCYQFNHEIFPGVDFDIDIQQMYSTLKHNNMAFQDVILNIKDNKIFYLNEEVTYWLDENNDENVKTDITWGVSNKNDQPQITKENNEEYLIYQTYNNIKAEVLTTNIYNIPNYAISKVTADSSYTTGNISDSTADKYCKVTRENSGTPVRIDVYYTRETAQYNVTTNFSNIYATHYDNGKTTDAIVENASFIESYDFVYTVKGKSGAEYTLTVPNDFIEEANTKLANKPSAATIFSKEYELDNWLKYQFTLVKSDTGNKDYTQGDFTLNLRLLNAWKDQYSCSLNYTIVPSNSQILYNAGVSHKDLMDTAFTISGTPHYYSDITDAVQANNNGSKFWYQLLKDNQWIDEYNKNATMRHSSIGSIEGALDGANSVYFDFFQVGVFSTVTQCRIVDGSTRDDLSYPVGTTADSANRSLQLAKPVSNEFDIETFVLNDMSIYSGQHSITNIINKLKDDGYGYYTLEYYPTYGYSSVHPTLAASWASFNSGLSSLSYSQIKSTYISNNASLQDKDGAIDGEYRPIDNLTTARFTRTASAFDENKSAQQDGYLFIKVYKEVPPDTPDPDFDVEFKQPNAGYKFDTTVVSTFMVDNHSVKEYTDLAPLNTTFDAFTNCVVDGVESQIQLYTTTKNVVCPGEVNNIFYYRWTVPAEDTIKQLVSEKTGVAVDNITITGFDVEAIVKDSDTDYTKSDTGTVDTARLTDSIVHKAGYDLYGGKSFSYSNPANDKTYFNTASWQEYVCNNGTFELLTNSSRVDFRHNLLRPDELASTQYTQNGQWFTRSGYALRTEVTTSSAVNSASDYITSQSMTPVQTAEVYFPEFNYNRVENEFEAMILDKTNNMFIFRDVENADTIRPRHYIPIWFPDRDYITQTYVSDAWCPVGMLTYFGESNPVGINGSLFDDYGTTQKMW